MNASLPHGSLIKLQTRTYIRMQFFSFINMSMAWYGIHQLYPSLCSLNAFIEFQMKISHCIPAQQKRSFDQPLITHLVRVCCIEKRVHCTYAKALHSIILLFIQSYLPGAYVYHLLVCSGFLDFCALILNKILTIFVCVIRLTKFQRTQPNIQHSLQNVSNRISMYCTIYVFVVG